MQNANHLSLCRRAITGVSLPFVILLTLSKFGVSVTIAPSSTLATLQLTTGRALIVERDKSSRHRPSTCKLQQLVLITLHWQSLSLQCCNCFSVYTGDDKLFEWLSDWKKLSTIDWPVLVCSECLRDSLVEIQTSNGNCCAGKRAFKNSWLDTAVSVTGRFDNRWPLTADINQRHLGLDWRGSPRRLPFRALLFSLLLTLASIFKKSCPRSNASNSLSRPTVPTCTNTHAVIMQHTHWSWPMTEVVSGRPSHVGASGRAINWRDWPANTRIIEWPLARVCVCIFQQCVPHNNLLMVLGYLRWELFAQAVPFGHCGHCVKQRELERIKEKNTDQQHTCQ